MREEDVMRLREVSTSGRENRIKESTCDGASGLRRAVRTVLATHSSPEKSERWGTLRQEPPSGTCGAAAAFGSGNQRLRLPHLSQK